MARNIARPGIAANELSEQGILTQWNGLLLQKPLERELHGFALSDFIGHTVVGELLLDAEAGGDGEGADVVRRAGRRIELTPKEFALALKGGDLEKLVRKAAGWPRKIKITLAEPGAVGLVEVAGERLRLTERGLLLANEVFVRLLPD